MDEFGLHPLSCRLSAGRFSCHAALSDVTGRPLDSAGFPSQLEPLGLDRGDGKRPEGITIFPLEVGKPLVWDATCSDTFSCGNLIHSAQHPCTAACQAEKRKRSKYLSLADRYLL